MNAGVIVEVMHVLLFEAAVGKLDDLARRDARHVQAVIHFDAELERRAGCDPLGDVDLEREVAALVVADLDAVDKDGGVVGDGDSRAACTSVARTPDGGSSRCPRGHGRRSRRTGR